MFQGETSFYQNIYEGFLPASLNSYRNHSVRIFFLSRVTTYRVNILESDGIQYQVSTYKSYSVES